MLASFLKEHFVLGLLRERNDRDFNGDFPEHVHHQVVVLFPDFELVSIRECPLL